MTKNIADRVWPENTATGEGGNYNSWEPDGSNYYLLTAGGYGTAPNIMIWDAFDQPDGEVVNQQAKRGMWRANGNFSFNNRPFIRTYQGIKCAMHNDPVDGQGNTRFGLGVENLDYTSCIEFFKIATPADEGKRFPGAATLNSFGTVSSLKWTWRSGYGWNGSAGECDKISLSHSGSSNFRNNGNNILGEFIGGFASAYKFSEWNSVLIINQPEIGNITGANGVDNTYMWNSAGMFAHIQDPYAMWQQNPDVTPSMQTPLKFDRCAVMGWSGGDNSNSQMLLAQYILYGGDDRGAYILLTDTLDPANAKKATVIGYDVWEDGQLGFGTTDLDNAEHNYYHIYSNLIKIETGAL